MSFADDLTRFAARCQTKSVDIFVNSCAAAKDSITDGSAVTGSPGQPVDTGVLKASWQLEFEDASTALISTNVAYAPANEYGVSGRGGPYTQRSPVGGRHSVALTVAGFGLLVADETRKVADQ